MGERLGVIGAFSYLKWTKKYTSHGDAELHVDVNDKNIALLKRGNVLFREDDNEAMYIYYRGFSDDETGRDQLVIKCFSVIRWLEYRILWDIYNFDDTPEKIARAMITRESITPSDIGRKIDQIQLGPVKNFGTPIKMQVSDGNVLDQVEALCNTYEMGIRAIFNGISLTFDFYEGTDRSKNQSVNPRCILSKSFSNVIKRNYEEADNDYKNTVLIAGAGEGPQRKRTSIIQGSGLSRRELFVDARDLQQTKQVGENDDPISDEEYTLILKQRGLEKLFDHEEFLSFECEIDVTKDNTKYGRDFFLGDIITIRDDKLQITMNSRIVEVDEVFQNDSKSVIAKVGKSTPTLPEKVKRMVK